MIADTVAALGIYCTAAAALGFTSWWIIKNGE